MISSSASNGNKLSSKRMMDGRQSPAYKIIMWSIMVLTSQHQLKSIHHCSAFSTFASFNGPSASSRLHISLQNQQRVGQSDSRYTLTIPNLKLQKGICNIVPLLEMSIG